MVILVVVESKAKTQKINQILGKGYNTIACYGHMLDLDPKKMSVDLKTFEPTYIPIKGKEEVIKDLKKQYKNAEDIIICSDLDAEGETIAYEIKNILKLKDEKRAVFVSITSDVILKEINNTRKIDMMLVESQQTRRVLDRIIGYEISPILWKTIGTSLSAGRVQSVTVRLIIDKENEIKKFFENEIPSYFKFNAIFNPNIEAILVENEKQFKVKSYDDAQLILGKCSKSSFIVYDIKKKDSFRNPPSPFMTATLQQEALRKLGFNVKKTMSIAQHLYESGYITYMRTDSLSIAKEAMDEIRETIINNFGEKYYREKNYTKKSGAGAHECIRPAHTTKRTIEKNKYGEDGEKLYDLIWKRTVACQMSPAKLDVTKILIDISKLKDYKFMSEFENIIFDGYLKVYGKEEKIINIDVKKNDELKCKEITAIQDYKKPPYRYDEASLVKTLSSDEYNIGRPSTYASIIDKIETRNYVKKDNIEGIEKEKIIIKWDGKISEEKEKIRIGKEMNKFVPTDLGKVVTHFLVENFKEIMDYEFTEEMEKKLDKIAEGKLRYKKVISEFYEKFHPLVENLKDKSKELKEKNTRVLGKHTNGWEIVATIARFGAVVKMCNPDDKKDCSYAPIKEPLTLETITLDDAIKLFEYPKYLGKYKEKDVKLMKGKFGFYLKFGKENISYENKDTEIKELDEAIKIINEKQKGKLWEETDKKGTVYTVLDGKFGKYVKIKPKKGKSSNVKIPEGFDLNEMNIDKVYEFIENKKKSFRKRFTKKNKE